MIDFIRIRELITEYHAGQNYGDLEYTFHLEAVAGLAKDLGLDETIQAACLLHDILEDTNMTREILIENDIPEAVIGLVEAVTDEPGGNRAEKKAKTYPKIRAVGQDAILVKLCDRVVNVMFCKLSRNISLSLMYVREHKEFESNLSSNVVHKLPFTFKNSVEIRLWEMLDNLIDLR